jgi:hypothetical protein
MPLFTEWLTRNVAIPRDSIVNLLVKSRYTIRKLARKTGNKLACVTGIPTAAWEEEAGLKTLLIKVFTGDSTRNRRLSCAGQAV